MHRFPFAIYFRAEPSYVAALVVIHGSRHPKAGDAAERRAIRFLASGAPVHDVTFRQLDESSRRFASVLARLGVQPGDRVATLMGRVPTLYTSVLGTLAAGAVYCPLFSAFGPEPVRSRLELGAVRVLVTTDLLYRRKVAPVHATLPGLEHVLVVRTPGAGELPDGTLDFEALLREASPRFETVRTPRAAWRPGMRTCPGCASSRRRPSTTRGECCDRRSRARTP